MSRRAASYTQADVARALRAAEQVAPGRFMIEIAPGGVIRVRPLEEPAHDPAPPAGEGAQPEGVDEPQDLVL